MPPGIKVEVVRQIKLPNWTGGDAKFWRDVEQAASDGIIENIMRQVQNDGSPIKRNAPSTRARKRRRGQIPMSLIDKLHRFIRPDGGSWRLRPVTKKGAITGSAIRPTTNELKRINGFVQKKGYTGWMGINKNAQKRIKKALTAFIKREIKKSERRSR